MGLKWFFFVFCFYSNFFIANKSTNKQTAKCKLWQMHQPTVQMNNPIYNSAPLSSSCKNPVQTRRRCNSLWGALPLNSLVKNKSEDDLLRHKREKSHSPLYRKISSSKKRSVSLEDGLQEEGDFISRYANSKLPYEILLQIFSYLSLRQLGGVCSVCKFWKEVSEADCLWRDITEKLWGGIGLREFGLHCSYNHIEERGRSLKAIYKDELEKRQNRGEDEYRIVVVGAPGVDKSAICVRFVQGSFLLTKVCAPQPINQSKTSVIMPFAFIVLLYSLIPTISSSLLLKSL